jgi:site-specific DNA-methyltransferase (adenine-specific)
MIKTKLIHGDCLEKLKELPDCSVDSVVTDPPYGLSFMGKKWDYDVPSVEVWKECLRVLKPGGHLLAFAGTRTQHRMAVRIEDAGFEIRDMIAWVYGSGFPKSLDVSKAIDKAAGHWRGKAGEVVSDNGAMSGGNYERTPKGNAITAAAAAWQGWGTALKPALEPITVARKPLGEKTVAANVLEHGTGALNVDGCRVGTNGETPKGSGNPVKNADPSAIQPGRSGGNGGNETSPLGRWPANLIHDGSDEVVGLFPQSSAGKTGRATIPSNPIKLQSSHTVNHVGHNDSGSAARFFYQAKSSKKDRGEGNTHPTVKPTDLMRYLCRLVTPPGGIVLDPFMGSGSTGKAAVIEGFNFIGIEREESYMEIAEARINPAKTPA